jgi:putative FmdB family regulatory protein
MPTYEYVCAKCGHEFEKFQSIADKPLAVCPDDICAQKKWARGKVKRKISAGAGLLFKGSGFYITDYRSEGYKQAAKKESESSKPAAASESKTVGKGEAKSTKPAAKKST